MEVAGILIGIIGIIVAVYFGIKSLVVKASLETSMRSLKRESLYVQPSTVPRVEEDKEKREGIRTVMEELKALDTKGYRSHPMVERILAERIDRLERDLEQERQATRDALAQKHDLEIKFVALKEKFRFQRMSEWIRNFAGIFLGITGTLFFSSGASQQKLWGIFSGVFILVFIITCIYSISGREKRNSRRREE
jgi:hypothetical protein